MRTYRQPILCCWCMLLKKTGLQPIRFTCLSKPPPSFGGLLGFPHQISIGGIMCLAARQHTGGTSVSPLLLRCSRTVPRSPRCHSPVIRCSDYWEGDTSGFRVGLETMGIRELLLPFTNILGCPGLDSLVGLEGNVCLGVFPRHPPTTGGAAFTLLVLFLG